MTLTSKEVVIVFTQKATWAGLAASAAITLASMPAVAAPIVLNPNFNADDIASDNAYNGGSLFYIQNWSPTHYASNTNTDPQQYDNGSAAGQTVVGFLSGAGTSLRARPEINALIRSKISEPYQGVKVIEFDHLSPDDPLAKW